MEHLLPIPLPMAITLLWRTPATQGKSYGWDFPGYKPLSYEGHPQQHYLGLTDVTVLCITEVLGAKHQSRNPLQGWFNHLNSRVLWRQSFGLWFGQGPAQNCGLAQLHSKRGLPASQTVAQVGSAQNLNAGIACASVESEVQTIGEKSAKS